jgi:[pyruvate, water dikinase]-phosphate phosphotransferase / [pyruvate, water dikinase] kinase
MPNYREISVHVVSDSLGETGEMVARAVVSQYTPGDFRIELLPRVTTPDQLRSVVHSHCGEHCIFLYTLVDEGLRKEMALLCAEGVNGVDILGPCVDLIERVTDRRPSGRAGAVHDIDREYFARIGAMEFAVSHDDGRNPEELPDADVVLVGVSRTSKTPLSMYLAYKGIRAANVPLAPRVDPPKELLEIDPRRVFGLMTDAELLIDIRQERMREMRTFVPRYAEREAVEEELSEARALMRRIGCLIIRTDNRAIEEAAQEIIAHLEGTLITKD